MGKKSVFLSNLITGKIFYYYYYISMFYLNSWVKIGTNIFSTMFINLSDFSYRMTDYL